MGRVCMGRVCYVPVLLWAEFVMCRVDPTPLEAVSSLEGTQICEQEFNNVFGVINLKGLIRICIITSELFFFRVGLQVTRPNDNHL